MNKRVIGIISVISGMVIVLLSIGTLLMQLIAALFGLWLINYGMQLYNGFSIQRVVSTYAFRQFFYR